MLAQKILPVVVTVGRAHHAVDVLACGLIAILSHGREVRGPLVVELNQNHRAVDAIVIDARLIRAAHPGEPGVVEVPLHFVHSHARMAFVHVADIQLHQV